jgi:hypothetical protein
MHLVIQRNENKGSTRSPFLHVRHWALYTEPLHSVAIHCYASM